MGNRGTYPQTAGRSDTLQGSTSFLHDVYQTSVARNLAGRSKNSGTTRPNVFFSRNFHCFGEEGQIADFGNFMFTDGTLPLPRNLKVSGEGPLFKVTWQEERMWKTVSGTDRLQIGVLYDNDSRIPRVASQVKGRRGELHEEFTLDESIGKKAHVYIFFCNETGTRFSACRYFHVKINS